jgi:uncharacterized protein (TIGR01777 family)
MRTLVTGATGLIGRHLLGSIDSAVVLSRRPSEGRRTLGAAEIHFWEPEAGPAPSEALSGVEIVFNLAGEPVAEGRWTDEKKRRIRDSRILGTRNLVASLGAMEKRPRVLVSASAVGYYGDRGDEELDERSAPGHGFLAEVCVDWEREANAAVEFGIRVVCVRIGIVLAPGGGALARMLTPFRLGVGGRLGTGRQWMPWVHIKDVAGIMLHASRDDEIHGPMNAVAPHPVTNLYFTRALARAVHRPAVLPVPGAALRIALGEFSDILLASQRVLPRVAEDSRYFFTHSELGSAMDDVTTSLARRTAAMTP